MKQLKAGNFKPTDLFDQHEDAEDRFYLAEYNFEEEKKVKEETREQNKKGVEIYG